MAVTLTPVSPILSQLQLAGSVNSGPIIQLLNPSGSGKLLVVYELGWSEGASALIVAARRNTSPVVQGPGGSTVTGIMTRFDPTNITPIVGVFQGFTFFSEGNSSFDETKWEWAGLAAAPATDFAAPHWIRAKGSFPWTVSAGSALEIALWNTGNLLRGYAVWDEV